MFIGNIVHSANEEDLRRMFGRFGAIKRFRVHSNKDKDWLPHYAFVTYENIDAVRRCLANRNSLYYPENSPDGHKLNVNGDESIVLPADEDKPKMNANADKITSSNAKRRRDLKQFQQNFVISTATRSDVDAVDKTVDPKTTKMSNDAQTIKARKIDSERMCAGRNMLRPICGSA